MALWIDSFWRALAYCLHPRVIGLSLLPLVLMVAGSLALGYFFWDAAIASVSVWLEQRELVSVVLSWLVAVGVGDLKAVFAPLLVLALAVPGVVLVCLLLVAWLMTPAMVTLVAERRFPALERRRGAGWWSSLGWSLLSTALALVAMLVSLPLWLVPPLILVLPPLIWGWLSYRVFAFDALADHADPHERRALMRQHRAALMGMGVVCGFAGSAPSLIWASGAMFIALAPLLVPLAVWIYTLVFAFASLWFAHYLLAALQRGRDLSAPVNAPSPILVQDTDAAQALPPPLP